MSTKAPASPGQASTALLSLFLTQDSAAQYLTSYDKLASWVDNMLLLYKVQPTGLWPGAPCVCVASRHERVQAELHRLLYPVFIHVYLKLVSAGATKHAAQLFSQHQRRFSQEGSPGADARAQVTLHKLQLCPCLLVNSTKLRAADLLS